MRHIWGVLALIVATATWLAPGSALSQDPAVQLTHDPVGAYAPAWSPDGTWIAFVSMRSGDEDIWAVPAVGGAVSQLTGVPLWHEREPAWSSGGACLSFNLGPVWGDQNLIGVIPPLGGPIDTLTAGGFAPDWSPEDDLLAAVGSIGGPYMYVFTVPPSGGDPFFLTFEPSSQSDPDWSPDGTLVAFSSHGEIWTVSAGGGLATQVTSGGAYEAAWSPDGRYIAYSSAGRIWALPVGGGASIPVTWGHLGGDSHPAWSPSGDMIAFDSDRALWPGGGRDIWVVPFRDTGVPAIRACTWSNIKALWL